MLAGKHPTLYPQPAGEQEPQSLPRAAAARFHKPGGRWLPPEGYVNPYRSRHKSLTSTLLNEEHARFKAKAIALGTTPTELATRIIRDYLAVAAPAMADDFESSTAVYEDVG